MAGLAAGDDAAAFFETRIRPVLIQRCYECHNTADTAEADLAVDWRGGIRAKTEHGTVVVPGKPAESLLLQVLRHQLTDLKMPQGSPKLEPEVIDDFAKWIAMGAFDPRERPPTAEERLAATSWDSVLEERKQWWSFQPVQNPPLPHSDDPNAHPIDRFIRAALISPQLEPAESADRVTLIRRLSFALTGLPPSPELF